ncbi:MAG TPA: permease-like cell division protein FtsX [Actinomycetota bacterium]
MRLEYYFRETAAGIRRNGIVAFAAMSTAFIALFLFGLSLLIAREFDLVKDAWTGNVQVAVYLTDPVRPDTIARIQGKLQELPAVSDEGGSIEYWDKTVTCEQYERLFEGQKVFQEGVDCEEAIPTSFRINLADASQYDQVTAALACDSDDQGNIVCGEAGVRNVSDFRGLLDRLDAITTVLTFVVGFIAAVMLIAAILLVANTLRMGMFARRKEIGIMRLVGATNWRIRVPFLIEGLVETLVGATLAIVVLFLLKVFAIDSLRGKINFFPLIRNSDVLWVAPWVLGFAALIAIIAGTIGMRRFLDV